MKETLVGEMLVERVGFGESNKARSASNSVEDAMSASIVHLLNRLAEVEEERDFYKSAATKLAKPKRRRKQ